MPETSVILPVYNAVAYVGEALTSLLNQTFTDFEILVLNDGSTDQSEQVIRSFNDTRIRYISSDQNKGLIYQLNLGVKEARGKYIARLDADDVALDNRLQVQFNYLERHPEIGLLGGNAEVLGSNELLCHSEKHDGILLEMLHRNAFIHSTVMFRKSIFEQINGGFDTNYKHAEDYRMWQLFTGITKLANLPEVLIKYRVHEQQVSAKHATGLLDSADQVRLQFIASSLNITLSREQENLHLALIQGNRFDFYPGTVNTWVQTLIGINRQNPFFEVSQFERYLHGCFARYVKGYYLWNHQCRNLTDWIKGIPLMWRHLTYKEIGSIAKNILLRNQTHGK